MCRIMFDCETEYEIMNFSLIYEMLFVGMEIVQLSK